MNIYIYIYVTIKKSHFRFLNSETTTHPFGVKLLVEIRYNTLRRMTYCTLTFGSAPKTLKATS